MHRDKHIDQKGWRLSKWGIGATVIVGVLAALLTLIIFRIQERSPELSVRFNLRQGGDPRSMECVITNNGRASSKSAEIRFAKGLPIGTEVFNDQGVALELIKTPILNSVREVSRNPFYTDIVGFAVRVGIIPPKSEAKFVIKTKDPRNAVGAKLALIAYTNTMKKVERIIAASANKYAEFPDAECIADLAAFHLKEANFFAPDSIAYEKQISKISIHTEHERSCMDRFTKLTETRRNELGPILNEFTPVQLPYCYVETTRGDGIQVVFPALGAAIFSVFLPDGIPQEFGKYFDEYMEDISKNHPSLKVQKIVKRSG